MTCCYFQCDGQSNILQGRENGFLSRLFVGKILYSFDYNKTSIMLFVNSRGVEGSEASRVQLNVITTVRLL